MPKVIYEMGAVSADGYIVGPDDDPGTGCHLGRGGQGSRRRGGAVLRIVRAATACGGPRAAHSGTPA